jgi:hypothetical protein
MANLFGVTNGAKKVLTGAKPVSGIGSKVPATLAKNAGKVGTVVLNVGFFLWDTYDLISGLNALINNKGSSTGAVLREKANSLQTGLDEMEAYRQGG